MNPNEKSTVEFLTKDEEKRLVYGVVYQPMIPDSQGDFATAAVIEDAEHRFMLDFQQMGVMHKRNAPGLRIVESYIAPCDIEINSELIIKGSWVLVSKAMDDEIWDAVKRGELNGYSLQGYGEAVEVDA